jgi:hypothetical protein
VDSVEGESAVWPHGGKKRFNVDLIALPVTGRRIF